MNSLSGSMRSGASAAEMYLDRFSDAVEHAERGLRVGRATGTTALAPTLVPVFGTCAWMRGDVDRGVGALEEAVEIARLGRNDLGLAWGLLNLSLAQAVEGDVEAAVRHGAEACELAESWRQRDQHLGRTRVRHRAARGRDAARTG